ncbi:hypothetical protein [Legionella cherrii]|uniref:DUF4153 domain-containing protein n=1 Tax=Legionella cherrii TaxID=28084 RepID=A0A0W0SBK0_9GAMM|nr:hypothetical protein [Legionella cherrii]KTC80481.1 hypothetical protein Lche_2501 [Legionella cherrii]VEB39244.1 Uncharacterised protein [Legionella cherrii]
MSSKKGIYLFTLIGLLLGLALDGLIRNEISKIFDYSLIGLFALLYALAYNNKNCVRLVASSFLIALFLSLPLLPMEARFTSIPLEHWFTFLCAFPIFVYVGHSFHYAYHHDNTWRISYDSLFAAVWNTILLLFVASVFSALANVLILLGAFIFRTVGSDYLWNLYSDNLHFRLISHVTLFFIGLGVGQQNIQIIYNLRFLLLRMMYYLFPFLALISIVYFVLYLGHSINGGEEYINPLAILIPLTSLGIIFFNAYFQDGSLESGAPSWLKLVLRVYRIILFLLVLMMTHKIFQSYSLDINIVICITTVILFSLTYAITACFPESMEQKWVRIGNICSALFLIIVLFLFNLPYMPIVFQVGTQPTVLSLTSQ